METQTSAPKDAAALADWVERCGTGRFFHPEEQELTVKALRALAASESTEKSALPHTARAFDLMAKGCRSMNLHSWEDHFDSLRQRANKGELDVDLMVQAVDYDYRNDNDGKAAATTLLTAVVADVHALAAANPALREACELFTKAAHDARDALNAAGIACPASIALAAEKARNALGGAA